ncbi:MAG: hypothetical protein COY69_00025, partial [Candidatus Magasanikbacteria bacterium CG_4_10_14_0_8_um_filter_32_14]
VDSVDTTGFTIRIRPVVNQDIIINWYAFGQVFDDNTSSILNTTESSSSSGSDNLTDLANNYLADHNLILDDTLENSTSTESISSDEITSSTEDNIDISDVTTTIGTEDVTSTTK